VALFCASSGLVGCGGGGGADDPLGAKAFVGTWVEDMSREKDAGASGVIVSQGGQKAFRELTFNDDGSFTMTLLDASSKKPLSPAQTCEGSWRVSGGRIVFDVQGRQLTGDYELWAPYRFASLSLKKYGDEDDAMLIQCDSSIRVRFIPAPE
jgi:hypothetical protein